MKRNNLQTELAQVKDCMTTYHSKLERIGACVIPEYTVSVRANCKVKMSDMPVMTSSYQVSELLRRCFDEDTFDIQEEFILMFLSRNNTLTGFYPVSKGGLTGTVADPRTILLAVANAPAAAAVILSHNHPSGNLKPSGADQEITLNVKETLRPLSIKVMDHIILSRDGYFSFADEGFL